MALIRSNGPAFPSFPRFFDDFFNNDLFDWASRNHSVTRTSIPAVNVVENPDNFVVEMAAPGMDKSDFNIELNNEVLTITSHKEARQQEDKSEGQFTRREFSFQSFQRSFHLPKTVVDDARIAAKYENGILQVVIPKREEAKKLPARTIAIE